MRMETQRRWMTRNYVKDVRCTIDRQRRHSSQVAAMRGKTMLKVTMKEVGAKRKAVRKGIQMRRNYHTKRKNKNVLAEINMWK
jgi:hypothetical protein